MKLYKCNDCGTIQLSGGLFHYCVNCCSENLELVSDELPF